MTTPVPVVLQGRAAVPPFRTGSSMSNVGKCKSLKLWSSLLLAVALAFGFGGSAHAQTPGEGAADPSAAAKAAHGHLEVRGPERWVRHVNLEGDGNEFSGTFGVENTGGGTLTVSRVAIRTSAADPRTPPGVTAEFEGGAGVKLAPGEKKTVTVKIDVEKFKAPPKPTATATAVETAPVPTAIPVEPPSKVPAYVVGGAGLGEVLQRLQQRFAARRVEDGGLRQALADPAVDLVALEHAFSAAEEKKANEQ